MDRVGAAPGGEGGSVRRERGQSLDALRDMQCVAYPADVPIATDPIADGLQTNVVELICAPG